MRRIQFEAFDTNLEFYEIIIKLLEKAGHPILDTPLYKNHDIDDLLYFDSDLKLTLSHSEKESLSKAVDISLLYQYSSLDFDNEDNETLSIYSIVLLGDSINNCENIHDIHRMIRPVLNCSYSIIFFYVSEQIIITMADSNGLVAISDTYKGSQIEWDLINKLNVANFSFFSAKEYFSDFLYLLSRWYYLIDLKHYSAASEYFPVNFFSYEYYRNSDPEVMKEEIKTIIHDIHYLPEAEYLDDYVEPDTIPVLLTNEDQILELLMDELETSSVSEGNFSNENEIDDTFMDDGAIFNDVDSEVFSNPLKMLEYIEMKNQ